jgi:NADH-quinone oxidoreductase subunit N
LALLLVAVIVTLVSVYYYLRIPYFIYLKKPENADGLLADKFSGKDWGYLLLAILVIGALITPNLFFELLNL